MARDTSKDIAPQDSPFNRTAQHDAKRAAILSQAAKLFNTKGSRATTLLDIAESLGLTKTSLYYYVKTKEELIYQCYMAALDRHHKTLDEVARQYSTPVERAEAFFRKHFESWQAAREGKSSHIAAMLEIASLKGAHRTEAAGIRLAGDHVRAARARGPRGAAGDPARPEPQARDLPPWLAVDCRLPTHRGDGGGSARHEGLPGGDRGGSRRSRRE